LGAAPAFGAFELLRVLSSAVACDEPGVPGADLFDVQILLAYPDVGQELP
jgi:hypothetical protein